MDGPEKAIQATKAWVDKVVVGLNFCPFAKREVQRNSIKYSAAKGEITEIIDCFLAEVFFLDKHPNVETTLVVIYQDAENFDSYLAILDQAQILLSQSGYDGIYQIASFHPDYLFEGEPASSPSHFTNRSPFPVLHILREASLDRVTKDDSRTVAIPDENIACCESLGLSYLERLLKSCQ